MNIAKSLRIAIATKNIKKQDLADELGIHKQQISTWLRTNSMNNTNLAAVASKLGYSVSEFIALGE